MTYFHFHRGSEPYFQFKRGSVTYFHFHRGCETYFKFKRGSETFFHFHRGSETFNLSWGPWHTFTFTGGPRLTFTFTGGQTISFWTGVRDLQFKTPLWFAHNPSLRSALNSSMSGLLIRMGNIAFRHCGFSIVGLSYRECFQVEKPPLSIGWILSKNDRFSN